MKSTTKLDFETRTTYMVTLTATDSFGESASIDVTIMVTDVDEAPAISEGGLAITGVARMDYAENGDRHGGNVHGLRAGCGHGYLGRLRATTPGTSRSAAAASSPSGVRLTTRMRRTPTWTTRTWSR